MFFILSKLLPPLVAPLGLMCLAAIAALILLWKRPRWAAIVLSAGLVVLLLASNGWTCAALVRSLEMRHVPTGDIPTAEAIVVLGGATRSQRSPRPWVEVNEAGDRVLYGAKLYRENRAPLLILSGGRVEWLGGEAPESEDMAKSDFNREYPGYKPPNSFEIGKTRSRASKPLTLARSIVHCSLLIAH